MLTADQVRLRLLDVDSMRSRDDYALLSLLKLMNDVLPELIEANVELRCALHLSELSRGVPSAVGRD